MNAMTASIRLAKHIAELAPCSRREAELYIEGGWVKVDGQVVEEPGFRLMPQQQVELMPQASLTTTEPVTILLHKPSGIDADAAIHLITADTLAPEDRTGLRFLKRHVAGLTLTESLDKNAGGLLVYTQDWRIVRKLIDDAARIEQEYIVEVTGVLIPDGLQLLNHGLAFNGKPLAPIKVSWQNETRLRFAIKAPARGLITHMCEKVGLKVLAMKRIRVGRISMAGLPSGQWRYLAGYERF
jgi:23S rRNA pseudouridine2604 synthase